MPVTLSNDFAAFFSPERLSMLMRLSILLFVGLPLIFILSRWIKSYVSIAMSAQRGMVAGKAIRYVGIGLVGVMILHELGFELAPLLGAAGILGIALGFASQTSVSNVISGIFLIAEQPFVVGDVITVGTTTGEVMSIDTLSIKIRTFDNRFVRIPNENILKSEVITLTRFPIRRNDLNISVAYKEDLGKVKKILLEIASRNEMCLQEPEPLIIFERFGASSIDLRFAVWSTKEEFLKLRNAMYEEIKVRFERENIEIPFPHISIYKGEATEPIPILNVGENKSG